ncbi:hypothetical protein [Campylobacter corcagiensis]|uniref:Uncharacterized protein n=1 Tax=Campylobacter corcagiensis TaxID=1448857 RepID=A0A7M1LIB5_9BACT|nr:hypothetical protein [Campylobacter corcagiensis]QKF64592.1 hypothetical protein CCORG_0734 [Campylobacter corcagiensis]QOQ87235.1 hypothetical protein IMC76_08505 [Campylobacter corcagiensis]
MNDFFNDLKAIKKELTKEQTKLEQEKTKIEESIKQREKRLQDEFLKYAKDACIKKI